MPALVGPFPLTPAGINLDLKPPTPAAFCLGTLGADGQFMPGYVGRVDDGLAAHLQNYIGSKQYDVFMYALAPSPHEAFVLECQIYHGFKPRDNTMHPTRPHGSTGWACPTCGRF
jgi:hypothetical protein